MSPALLDSTAPERKSNPNGQISPLFPINFYGFSSMNQSNSNTDPSRFPNSNESTSDMSLNERGLGFENSAFGSASGRLKPRRAKLRKPKGKMETGKIDSGFNPFRPVSDNSIPELGSSFGRNLNFGNVGNEGFIFGASQEKASTNLNSSIGYSSGVVRNIVVDEMSKLKIATEQEVHVGNSSGFVGNKILDDMGKLKIGCEQEFVNASDNQSSSHVDASDKEVPVFGGVYKRSGVDESEMSNLPEEIRKLKIEGSGNRESSKSVKDVNSNLSVHNKTQFSFGSGDDGANPFGTSVASELPNELKKLNIKGIGNVDVSGLNHNADSMKKFVFEDIDKMNNLNIKESVNGYGGEKKEANYSAKGQSAFVFGSRGASGSLDGGAETMLSAEKVKFKIARQARDNTSQRQTSFGSPTTVVESSMGGNKKFQDAKSSIPAEFSFQAGLQGQNLIGSQVPHDHFNDHTRPYFATASSAFSSGGVHSNPVGNLTEVPFMDKPEKMDEFHFTSSWDGKRMCHAEFTTPNGKGNIFAGLDKKLEFSAKLESAKDAKSKKKRGKLKKHTSAQQMLRQDFVLRRSSSKDCQDSFESYSPMDVSPYQEILADNIGSRETSVTSEEAFHPYINDASSESCPTVLNDATDEDLVFATQHMDINERDVQCTETKLDDSQYQFGKGLGAGSPSQESVMGAETESFKSANDELDCNTDSFVTAADSEVSSSLRIERLDGDVRLQFSFASASEDVGGTSFMFAAPSSSQGQSSAAMRHQKKKNRVKVAQESYNPTPNTIVSHSSPSMQFFPISDTTSLLSPRRGQKGDLPPSLSKRGDKTEGVKEQETKPASTSTASIAAQEACEKWRLRGNQAYANGDISRAEDYYTQGVNCVSENENSRSCLRALMLCYSNRAATRMSLGKMTEALADCMKAAAVDPNFLRVQVRAANCHLALGEIEDASLHFMKCLQSGGEACVDRKLILEASEGLEKAQKVLECMKQSAELLQRRTSGDAESALSVIAQALTISSYCERLLEMKADALFMLRKYEELIQLCEQTLSFAEMNCRATSADDHSPNPSFRLWRWRLSIRSYFYLGRLEEALDFLKKQEESVSKTEESESKTLESLIPLAGTITELVRHKTAGNEAFQSGRHAEAVEHYTAALSCTVESRPFAAVCFCNRAAVYKAMGQIVDAIADCSLAIALDGNYLKAVSRRANLFEMIRDYDQATMDLQRLVSILMKQVEDRANQSGASDRTSRVNELRQAQQRLFAMEEEARKEIPLNMYLILGIDPSVTVSEIKKAYRKAALRHHPDKAAQSLAKSENGDDGLWREIFEGVHKDADRLFKMIGEAYAVLSDPTKRSRYDLEEEMRNTQNRGSGGGASRMHTDVHNYAYERSSSRRQWQEVWRSYGNSQARGSETNRSSRHS